MRGRIRYSLQTTLLVATLFCVWLAQCSLRLNLVGLWQAPDTLWLKILSASNFIVLATAIMLYKRYGLAAAWVATLAITILTAIAAVAPSLTQ